MQRKSVCLVAACFFLTLLWIFAAAAMVPCTADLDLDADIDRLDPQVVYPEKALPDCEGQCRSDFDGDGVVNGIDLAFFAEEFGRTEWPGLPVGAEAENESQHRLTENGFGGTARQGDRVG